MFYTEALDDLNPTQLNHGFDIAKRNLGTFMPGVDQLRKWCESWRPAGLEGKYLPTEKSDLVKAGVYLKITKEQVAEWLQAGKEVQREYQAKLAEDPEWQMLYERFGKPGLRAN